MSARSLAATIALIGFACFAVLLSFSLAHEVVAIWLRWLLRVGVGGAFILLDAMILIHWARNPVGRVGSGPATPAGPEH